MSHKNLTGVQKHCIKNTKYNTFFFTVHTLLLSAMQKERAATESGEQNKEEIERQTNADEVTKTRTAKTTTKARLKIKANTNSSTKQGKGGRFSLLLARN